MVPATKPYITFQGAGRHVTVIEWHDRACDRGPDGQQLRTYHTASVTVFANYFTARNVSFKVRNYSNVACLSSYLDKMVITLGLSAYPTNDQLDDEMAHLITIHESFILSYNLLSIFLGARRPSIK